MRDNGLLVDTHAPILLNDEISTRVYSQNISIVTFKKSKKNKLLRFEHSHPQYEFCLPLTPIPFLTLDGAVYFGEIGWVFPAPRGYLHGLKYDISDISMNSIIIGEEYFESLMREKGYELSFPATPFKATDGLKMYIEAFKKEFFKGDSRDKHKLRHLTALICDELIDEGMEERESAGRVKSGYQRGIRSAAEFLNDNYDKPISLDEVARMCGFSRNYFTTSFRIMFGDTPLVYLTKLRVSKAKLLLETTNDTILVISEQCGYTKQNTFTQAFKATTGMNPTQYRAAIKS